LYVGTYKRSKKGAAPSRSQGGEKIMFDAVRWTKGKEEMTESLHSSGKKGTTLAIRMEKEGERAVKQGRCLTGKQGRRGEGKHIGGVPERTV